MHARQAITTKYLGPTNTRGQRVKATCAAGSITVAWDDAQNSADNHALAVAALVRKLEWHPPTYKGSWHLGGLPDGGYVAVYVCDETRIDVAGGAR